jgi:hypothetical protein
MWMSFFGSTASFLKYSFSSTNNQLLKMVCQVFILYSEIHFDFLKYDDRGTSRVFAVGQDYNAPTLFIILRALSFLGP